MTRSALSRHVCQFSTLSFTHWNGFQDSERRGIKTSGGAEGPVPPCRGGKLTLRSQPRGLCSRPSCGRKSEKQAGMREGSVMAELGAELNV
ncbi:hypothetical protein EYF80_002478 [Liparis tanakae]|uniref:Uncharacterized protein n=1 Tax=Liparis tanakae TaxID=230148 RepID=A0A4Z2JAT3_9TELE|nr:hypothetical protein EYF80_002478 [Liparis tanakae]